MIISLTHAGFDCKQHALFYSWQLGERKHQSRDQANLTPRSAVQLSLHRREYGATTPDFFVHQLLGVEPPDWNEFEQKKDPKESAL
jgi:hypothetical protein